MFQSEMERGVCLGWGVCVIEAWDVCAMGRRDQVVGSKRVEPDSPLPRGFTDRYSMET